MGQLIRVALLPFVLAWALLRLLAAPAVILLAAWFLTPDGTWWFPGITAAVGLYLFGVLSAWRTGVRGTLRSLGRGPVEITSTGRTRRGRGRR
ncbi:hypothetical protein [Umezawaea beigongshangensis]|uniref:hypothetical protein n=1 Tax=Umezawaea beigongshangensis TaxID=2780383 RepID=UPI0018F19973|nr:hypothetical protein [Umezawaea beigongshangensis]